jgi:multidrug efflux pump subunit AcrA (membrane-fusion protein)
MYSASTDDKKKKPTPKWLWWVIGIVVILVIIAIVFYAKRKGAAKVSSVKSVSVTGAAGPQTISLPQKAEYGGGSVKVPLAGR